jgi:hypothetical protein
MVSRATFDFHDNYTNSHLDDGANDENATVDDARLEPLTVNLPANIAVPENLKDEFWQLRWLQFALRVVFPPAGNKHRLDSIPVTAASEKAQTTNWRTRCEKLRLGESMVGICQITAEKKKRLGMYKATRVPKTQKGGSLSSTPKTTLKVIVDQSHANVEGTGWKTVFDDDVDVINSTKAAGRRICGPYIVMVLHELLLGTKWPGVALEREGKCISETILRVPMLKWVLTKAASASRYLSSDDEAMRVAIADFFVSPKSQLSEKAEIPKKRRRRILPQSNPRGKAESAKKAKTTPQQAETTVGGDVQTQDGGENQNAHGGDSAKKAKTTPQQAETTVGGDVQTQDGGENQNAHGGDTQPSTTDNTIASQGSDQEATPPGHIAATGSEGTATVPLGQPSQTQDGGENQNAEQSAEGTATVPLGQPKGSGVVASQGSDQEATPPGHIAATGSEGTATVPLGQPSQTQDGGENQNAEQSAEGTATVPLGQPSQTPSPSQTTLRRLLHEDAMRETAMHADKLHGNQQIRKAAGTRVPPQTPPTPMDGIPAVVEMVTGQSPSQSLTTTTDALLPETDNRNTACRFDDYEDGVDLPTHLPYSACLCNPTSGNNKGAAAGVNKSKALMPFMFGTMLFALEVDSTRNETEQEQELDACIEFFKKTFIPVKPAIPWKCKQCTRKFSIRGQYMQHLFIWETNNFCDPRSKWDLRTPQGIAAFIITKNIMQNLKGWFTKYTEPKAADTTPLDTLDPKADDTTPLDTLDPKADDTTPLDMLDTHQPPNPVPGTTSFINTLATPIISEDHTATGTFLNRENSSKGIKKLMHTRKTRVNAWLQADRTTIHKRVRERAAASTIIGFAFFKPMRFWPRRVFEPKDLTTYTADHAIDESTTAALGSTFVAEFRLIPTRGISQTLYNEATTHN